MKNHYLVLDTFRGLCACLVAMSHFNASSLFNDYRVLNSGSIYVDFFFVLSGFVIFANYEDRLQQGYSKAKFILLRFGRVYPLHFFVLLAFIAIDLLQYVVHIDGAALYKPFSAPGETPRDIAGMFLLIHSLNFSETLSLNGPSWSISVEFYTYILFALVLAYGGKFYRIIIVAMALACAVSLYQWRGELYAKLDYGFLRCIYGFACGAMAWEIYRYVEKSWRDNISGTRFTLLELASFSATIFYITYFSTGAASMLAPIVCAILILLFAFEGGALSKVFKIGPLVFVGMLSYSIYMIHLFISGKFFELPIRLLESKTDFEFTVVKDGLRLYGENVAVGTAFELFYLAVVIGCAYISYKLIEEPFRNWSRQLAQKMPDYPTIKAQNATTGVKP